MDDEAISICVDRLWRFGLPGFSGGRQGFSRHDRSGEPSCAHWRSTEEHQLRDRLDLTVSGRDSITLPRRAAKHSRRSVWSSIVAEVEKACARKASQTLASAVWTTYLGAKALS